MYLLYTITQGHPFIFIVLWGENRKFIGRSGPLLHLASLYKSSTTPYSTPISTFALPIIVKNAY